MDLEQARQLRVGQILHHTIDKNKDGTPERWRVNGRIKTWKTRPDDIRIPLKRGLFDYGYLTDENMHLFVAA